MPLLNGKTCYPDQINTPIFGVTVLSDTVIEQPLTKERHILIYSPRGVVKFNFSDRIVICLPQHCILVPCGVPYQLEFIGTKECRFLYFKTDLFKTLDQERTFTVNPLLRALIERIALLPFNHGLTQNNHLLGLIMEELSVLPTTPISLQLPKNIKIKTALDHYKNIEKIPSLEEIAQYCSYNVKTVTRNFSKETGLTYRQWMQQMFFIYAVEALANGCAICKITEKLPFANDSAFSYFFRSFSGLSPKQFQHNLNNASI